MHDIDAYKEKYHDGIIAELVMGYEDGRIVDSIEPGGNRHPAYIHGFMNGRDDIYGNPRKSAQALREDFAYIESVFGS